MARELTPAATLGAYSAGLALVFVAAFGVGRVVGPVGTAPDVHGGTGTHSTGSGGGTASDGRHTPSTSGEAR
jgi:hypothetical protein